MKASDERVVDELLACWRHGSQSSDAEKKAALEQRFSETAEYKSIYPRVLELLIETDSSSLRFFVAEGAQFPAHKATSRM